MGTNEQAVAVIAFSIGVWLTGCGPGVVEKDGGPVGDDGGSADAGREDAGREDAGPECVGTSECVPGWGCVDGACACDSPGPEVCDELDDDCDGQVDEGSGDDVGCGFAEVCVDGACGCPAERMCGARCVDIDRDPEHCGSCATACAEGQQCAVGSCCTPSGAETCNGADDDCDGQIDEGTPSALGCAGAEMCSEGACTCPSANLCGAACRDTSRDPDHCGACGAACATGDICEDGVCCQPSARKLDLLFMIDNSGSMGEEQAALAAQLPRMIEALTTGDLNGDGTPEFPPVEDLHAGVITPDMGTGGFPVPTCPNPDHGDDGILRTDGSGIAGCATSYPSFLAFSAGDDAAQFAQDFQCVALRGESGCGFEQQLEATLKALTPSTSSIGFHGGTRGHADVANAGFLRDDSLVGVVLITDEEDCSAADGELFNPESTIYSGSLNLRCAEHATALHPIARYVDGLVDAVGGQAGRLVFSLIAGVPSDLVSDPSNIDYAAILADSRMQPRPDPMVPERLTPSCNTANGLAFPPVRMVEVARDLQADGASAVVQSICQADFTPALDAIMQRLASGLGGSCG